MHAFKAKVYDIEQGRNEVVLNEHVARQLGITIADRVELRVGQRKATAIVNLGKHSVHNHQIGLFLETAQALSAKTGSAVDLSIAPKPASLDAIKRKLDGKTLEEKEIQGIISDLMNQNLAATELAVFIAAVHTRGMAVEETIALTDAIFHSGEVLKFKKGAPVLSEHSIGGVAGDRTSMLFTPIMASLGIRVPKTCSRAISSAAGTADVMELFCPVALSAKKMKAVVDQTGGCLVWGGAVNMAAADDKLIQIRHPLHLDPHPLLLSSILAKKKAEGAQYVLLDIPTGPGTKVRETEEARALAKQFTVLAAHLGLKLEVTITDGSEPLMPFVGPALEGRAVLQTLEGRQWNALAEKACQLCGISLAMLKGVTVDEGYRMARQRVEGGHALKKFKEIVAAQGGKKEPQSGQVAIGTHVQTVRAREQGQVSHIDNRKLSRVARALGAPEDKMGGIHLLAMRGDQIQKGQPLFDLYASDPEKLAFGVAEAKKHNPVYIGRIVIDVV